MKEIYEIQSLEQVKVLADPLRQQILEQFCHKPLTTKQLAIVLGEKPTRLYHHVDLLEKAGLIRLRETRKNRGTVEKYFESVARIYRVDHKLLSPDPEDPAGQAAFSEMITQPVRATLEEIERNIAGGKISREGNDHTAVLSRGALRIGRERIPELRDKVIAWIHEMNEECDGQGDELFTLLVAFYPSHPAGDAGEQPGEEKS